MRKNHSLTAKSVKPLLKGYVLAGGRSTRMGRDKASLAYRGSTLLECAAAAVARAAGNVTIVGGAPRPGFRTIPDLYPGTGPAGGIVTALRDAGEGYAVVTACDTPLITPNLLARIAEAAVVAQAEAVVAMTPDGRLHPLCACYNFSAAVGLQRCVEEGIHTVRRALDRLKTIHFAVEDPRLLTNVNTPEEWAELLKGQD